MLWKIKCLRSIILVAIPTIVPSGTHDGARIRHEHEEGCCRAESTGTKRNVSEDSGQTATLPCVVEACKKSGTQLPQNCRAGGLNFSIEAGNMVNLTSKSRPTFSCTWICVHETRPELRERHGPWALLAIDGDLVSHPSLRQTSVEALTW